MLSAQNPCYVKKESQILRYYSIFTKNISSFKITQKSNKDGGIFLLGDRIKFIREANKMNQVEFGQSLNVTKQTVSNWENNNVTPSIDVLKAISIKYGVSTDFLLEIDDRIIIYAGKELPTHIVAHIQVFINDLISLLQKRG